MSFESRFLKSDISTAEDVQRVLYKDFLRLPSMTDVQARSIADPQDPEKVHRQLERLRNPGRNWYLGQYMANRLIAVAKVGPWTDRDQKPFGNRIGTALWSQISEVNGLHAFALEEPNNGDVREWLGIVLDEISEEVELRAAVDAEDGRLHAALIDKGAQVTVRGGRIALGHTEREYDLHILRKRL